MSISSGNQCTEYSRKWISVIKLKLLCREEANRSAHASGDVATAGEIPERDPSRAPIYAGVIFQVR